MKKALYAVVVLAVAAGGFFLGRFTAPQTETSTFYATIESINGNAITVAGLEVNDINSRGRFTFSIGDETDLVWRSTKVAPEDFDVGDTVSITYTGDVAETEPAQIACVVRLQLLSDER